MTYNATANEQLMLELLNRARLDPAGEAARYGIALNEGRARGTLSANARQPLAMNEFLLASARGHSRWMIDNDVFAHTGAGGSSPGGRMAAAGYGFSGTWAWGENIAWRGTTAAADLTAMLITEHKDLFVDTGIAGRGHRLNMLNGNFREVGIGQSGGQFIQNRTNYNSSMVTQDFARSGTFVFLTGVSYNDSDANKFYSIGEGRANTRISDGAVSTLTGASGGYSLALSSGVHSITFSGYGVNHPMTITVDLSAGNVKLDVVSGSQIFSSGSLTLGQGADAVRLLGVANLFVNGNAAADTITGNAGANTLHGGDGNDTITGGLGSDNLFGDAGDDVLRLDVSTGGDLDILDGGAGSDTADFSLFGAAAWVDLALSGVETRTRGDTNLSSGTWRSIADLMSIENVTGTAYSDQLYGTAGNNVLTGGAGNDLLTGRAGSDTFVFTSSFGHDTIMDWQDTGSGYEDVIRFAGVTGVTSFASLSISDTTAGLKITYGTGANYGILSGQHNLASLTAADFQFA